MPDPSPWDKYVSRRPTKTAVSSPEKSPWDKYVPATAPAAATALEEEEELPVLPAAHATPPVRPLNLPDPDFARGLIHKESPAEEPLNLPSPEIARGLIHAPATAAPAPLRMDDATRAMAALSEHPVPDAAAAPSGPPEITIGERFRSAGNRFAQSLAGDLPAGVLEGIALLAKELDPFGEYEGKDAQELATAQAAQKIRDFAQRAFPTNPELQGKFLEDVLPQALGSMAGFVAGGLATGGGGLFAGTTGALMQGGGAYEEARADGADEETARKAGLVNLPLGALEAAPVERILSAAAPAARRGVTELLREAAIAGGEEALQEGVQQVGGNVVTRDLGIDPNRPILEGVGTNMLAGALAGGIAGGGAAAVGRARGRTGEAPEAAPAAAPAAPVAVQEAAPTPEPAPAPKPKPEKPQPVEVKVVVEEQPTAAVRADNLTPSRVVAAAVRAPDGTIYQGPIHADALDAAVAAGSLPSGALRDDFDYGGMDQVRGHEMGFLTDDGRFLSRAETAARHQGREDAVDLVPGAEESARRRMESQSEDESESAPAREPKRNLFGEEQAPTVEQANIFTPRELAPAEKVAAERTSGRKMNAAEVAAQTEAARAEGSAPAARDADTADLFEAPASTAREQRTATYHKTRGAAKALKDAALLDRYRAALRNHLVAGTRATEFEGRGVRIKRDYADRETPIGTVGTGAGAFQRGSQTQADARLAAYEEEIRARGLEIPHPDDAFVGAATADLPRALQDEHVALRHIADDEVLERWGMAEESAASAPDDVTAQVRRALYAGEVRRRGLEVGDEEMAGAAAGEGPGLDGLPFSPRSRDLGPAAAPSPLREVPAAKRAERPVLYRTLEEADRMMDGELLEALDDARTRFDASPKTRTLADRVHALETVARDRGLVDEEEPVTALYSGTPRSIPAGISKRTPRTAEPEGIEAGPPAIPGATRIPVAPLPGGEPKRLSKIILDLSKGLARPVRKGKPPSGAGGVYFPGSTRTVIRYTGDLDTTAHEVAHALDDRYGIVGRWAGNRQRSPFDGELIPHFSQHGSETKSGPRAKLAYRRAEGVAEWVRAWVVNPDAAEAAAPQFAAHFKKTVPAPALDRLKAFSDDVRRFAGLDPVERTKANVQFAPEEPSLLERFRSATDREGEDFQTTWWDRLGAVAWDELKPLMSGIHAARALGGVDTLLPSEDPEVLVRLFSGNTAKLEDVLARGPITATNQRAPGIGGGLDWLLGWADTKTEAALQQDLEDVAAYMISQRVVEKAEAIDEEAQEKIDVLRDLVTKGQLKQADFQRRAARLTSAAQFRKSRLSGAGGGIFADDQQAAAALKTVRSWDADRRARMEEGAKRYRRWSNAVLRYMVDKGRLSEEQYQEISQDNRFYVAMHRIATEIDPDAFARRGRGGGKRLGSKADPVKRFTGSTREIGNPYANLLAQTAVMMREADRNEAIRSFSDLLAPKPTRGLYQGPVVRFDAIGAKVASGEKNAIPIYRDGRAEYWQFEAGIHKAVKGLGNEYFLPPVLTWTGRVMRYFVVHSPPFLVRNVIRDASHRAQISRTGSKPWDVLHAVTAEQVSEFSRAGGNQAGFYRHDQVAYYRALKQEMLDLAGHKSTILATPKALVHGWEKLSQGSELVGRMAEYRKALEHAKKELGYDEYNAQLYAASQSRDLIDYAVAGTWGRTLNQLVPFTNPGIQGLRRLVRAAGENPKKMLTLWALYSLAPTLLTYAFNVVASDDDGEEYRQQPSYLRDLFWNYKVGPDLWLRIPKSFESGVLATGVERAIDRMAGHKDAFEGYFGSVMKSFLPVDESALLGPARIAVEMSTNYDLFRDKHIVSPFDEGKAVALRKGTKYSSRLGQAFAAMLPGEVDPRMVDYLIKNEFGGAGQLAVAASDIGKRGVGRDVANLAESSTGLFVHSPGYAARDVETLLDRLKYLGVSTQGREFRRFNALRDATQEGSAAERDAAAKQLRAEAKRLRQKYEKITPDDMLRRRAAQ